MDYITINNFETKIYSNVPDCISNINSYKEIISDIFNLTDGILVLNDFEGINQKGREFKLNLTISSKKFEIEFEGSGYFYQDILLDFNRIIREFKPDETKILFELNGFDYDFAVVFEEAELEYSLAREQKIWRSEYWISQYEQKMK